LVFHGVYSYKPNYCAIKIISEKILPILKKKGINSKLLAIGGFSPKNIENPDVIFTGAVKDLPSYIGATDIAVVPLQAGGGIRMKILEYFAAKIPVISTKKGAEGIDAKNGKEIIITEISDFPNQITKLIKSEELRKRMTKNAFEFVQNYDWKKICQKYIEIYKNTINDR
jgi:glycosyltransferase involved in cell wall biosynthesis